MHMGICTQVIGAHTVPTARSLLSLRPRPQPLARRLFEAAVVCAAELLHAAAAEGLQEQHGRCVLNAAVLDGERAQRRVLAERLGEVLGAGADLVAAEVEIRQRRVGSKQRRPARRHTSAHVVLSHVHARDRVVGFEDLGERTQCLVHLIPAQAERRDRRVLFERAHKRHCGLVAEPSPIEIEHFQIGMVVAQVLEQERRGTPAGVAGAIQALVLPLKVGRGLAAGERHAGCVSQVAETSVHAHAAG
mmetsp:Transcript_25615/g.83750  ORF Transcript_25615/g.83750 Transcript_25615/m.83750 type:complete len:247 (+) Transcript_25615:174-914(+)